VESLIVAYRCKLELWDDDKGLEKGTAPDAVVDRSSRLTLGRNKYEKHNCMERSTDHFWGSTETPRHVMLQSFKETPLPPFHDT